MQPCFIEEQLVLPYPARLGSLALGLLVVLRDGGLWRLHPRFESALLAEDRGPELSFGLLAALLLVCHLLLERIHVLQIGLQRILVRLLHVTLELRVAICDGFVEVFYLVVDFFAAMLRPCPRRFL